MEPVIERTIAQRASSQLGLFTRSQARAAGMSRAALARRLDSGRLRLVGNQVLWPAGLPVRPTLEVMAACLDVGGIASHRTAGWSHSLERMGWRTPVEVAVRKGQSTTTTPLAHVHTTTNLDPNDVLLVNGVPTTSVARTLLDLSALAPDELDRADLVAMVEAAVRDRQASDRWLWWLLEGRRCRGRNGVSTMESVLSERAALGPTESWLERETLRILEAARLPLPRVQRVFRRKGAFVSRADFAYDHVPVVIEVEGKMHLREHQARVDARQRNDLQLLGHTILTFTYDVVVRTPDVLVRTVAEALAQAEARQGTTAAG